MKKEVVASNTVQSSSFKYYFKEHRAVADDMRQAVVVSMKDMLGAPAAATVRVSAA